MASHPERLHGADDNGLRETFDFMASRYLPQTIRVSMGRYPGWMAHVAELVESYQPQSVVDVGCGPGYLLTLLREALPNADLVGVDYSPAMLDLVPAGIPTQEAALSDWALEGGRDFDVVVMTFVLRDQPQPDVVLEQVKRRLKSGGRLVVLETQTPRGFRATGFDLYFHRWMPWWGRTRLAPDWSGPADQHPYRWLSNSHRIWHETHMLPDAFGRAGYSRWQPHTDPDDMVMLWSAQRD